MLVPGISIALAVAAPAVAAPAAEAAPRAHHPEASALKFGALRAIVRRTPRLHRLSAASFAGLATTGAAAAPSDPPAPAANSQATDPQAINPDAPPMVPNPTPTTNAGTGGLSIGASYYEGLGGGATLVAAPQGAYVVPEFGIGFGPSVSAAAGSNVNVPNAPQLQLGFTGGD